MAMMSDRVPMFKMRPNTGLLVVALFVLIVGGLFSAYFFTEDAYSDDFHRGIFALVVTVVLCLLLVIAATSRMWFRHLWHHRPGYKRG